MQSLALLLLIVQPPQNPGFARVDRGDVALVLQERGEFEPVKKTDLVCKVRPIDRRETAGIVQWVAEDGAIVKQGEVLLRLDPGELREKVTQHEIAREQAAAGLAVAEKEREYVQARLRLDIESAQGQLELAELDLSEAKTASEKKRAEIKHRQARAALDLAKLEAEARKIKADAALLPARAALTEAASRLDAAKEDLNHCVLVAPHEGFVTYYVPESGRFAARGGMVAAGEPVKPGQKLLSVADLSRMQVRLKLPESMVNRVRVGMPCQVRFLDTTLPGKVASVANLAEATDWLTADVKVYSTVITLAGDEPHQGLRPGMTAQVNLPLDIKQNVLRVPAQAVRTVAGQRVCHVKEGDKLVPRGVKTGLANTTHVEIVEGLEEGEEISLTPPALPREERPARPNRSGTPSPNDLTIQSVRPAGPAAEVRRSFVERYGLTDQDLAAVKALVPEKTLVAGVRHYAVEVRSSGRPATGRLVEVSPEYLMLHSELQEAAQGRRLADLDFETAGANVVVLGHQLATELFPSVNAIGQTLRLTGQHATFAVVGVLRPAVQPDSILVPMSTARNRLGNVVVVRTSGTRRAEQVQLSEITLRFPDRQSRQATEPALRAWLSHAHPERDWVIP